MFEKICAIFKELDLFRQPVVFYYNGKNKRTSFLGLLCSLLIYIYLFYSFFNSNFFLKNVPLVIPKSIDNDRAEPIYFDSSRTLIFGISDPLNGRFTDPTYFQLLFRYFHNQSYFEERKLKLCELEDVNGNLSFYQKNKLGEMFCLKDNSFYIEGSLDQGLRYISISILLCDNATSNNTCKSPEEINNYFDSFASQKFFNILYDDRRVDIQDYANPVKNTKKVISQLIDHKIKKKYLINFKKMTVLTESGILFSDVHKISDFSYASMEFDFQFRMNSAQPLSQYIFLTSKEELIYNRRYQSFAEFLANFIAVSKFISVICFIFINNLIHVNTLKHLITKLYALPPNINKKKKSLCRSLKRNKKNDYNLENKKNVSDGNKSKIFNIAESNLNFQAPSKENFTKKRENSFNLKVTSQKNNQKSKVNNQKEIKLLESGIQSKDFISGKVDIGNKKFISGKNDSKLSDFFLNTKGRPEVELHESHDIHKPYLLNKNEELDIIIFESPQIESKEIKPHPFSDNALNSKKREDRINDVAPKNEEKIVIKSTLPNIINNSKNKISRSQKITEKIKSFFGKNYREEEPRNKLHLSFWEYVMMKINVFRSEKPLKDKLIEKAEKTYQEDLDVVNVVTKLHDLDKLKILLLDEDQLVIFNYLSKPIISLDNLKESEEPDSNPQKKLTTLLNRKNNAKAYLEQSYKKILEKNDKISEKLIEFLDREISLFGEK